MASRVADDRPMNGVCILLLCAPFTHLHTKRGVKLNYLGAMERLNELTPSMHVGERKVMITL